jgi:hypothetical protein
MNLQFPPLTILSLFDHSGVWSEPYRRAGFNVIQVDLKHGVDVLTLKASDLPPVFGILAAPPCTDFSVSGAQYWKAKDADGRTAVSLALVDKTLELVRELKPEFWVLENPVGRLPKLRPEIGTPYYFHPYEFAGFADDPETERYTKKTGLWGEFNRDLEKLPLEPIRVCSQGSWIQALGGKSDRTKELRSKTPTGFARSFCRANGGTMYEDTAREGLQ